MNRAGKEGIAEELLAKVKHLDSISARLVLLDAYEVTYGIYNHAVSEPGNERPLALVAMHDKENVTIHSELYNTIRRFRRYKVYQNFGIGFDTFMSLPTEYCTFILEMLGDEAAKEAEALSKRLQELERGHGNSV